MEVATIFPPRDCPKQNEKDHRGNGGPKEKQIHHSHIIAVNGRSVKSGKASSAIEHLLNELREAHLQLAIASQEEQLALMKVAEVKKKLEYHGIRDEQK